MTTENNENKEKLKAAYALNLWTVSISQIIEYNDMHILEQEYDNIMNNLNLQNMPKDEALLDVIKEIMDEIVNLRIDDGDRRMIEREYQHQLRNAVWSAVPNVGAIFATANPVVIGVTLATQVGIGYMNYRRNKAGIELDNEKAKWQIQKNRMQHLHGLQKQLFDTAWRLAKTYEFPDKYRLVEKQISEYNEALMEANPLKRLNMLEHMKNEFLAYPAFWYQIGSTANQLYQTEVDEELKSQYKDSAIKYFEEYWQLNEFNLLRYDVLTASWALEYLELQDMHSENQVIRAKQLIGIAESHSGNALDILELCAFSYLRVRAYDDAVRLFHFLVNKGYNIELNTQVLSGLYIQQMFEGDSEIAKRNARIGYKQLPGITDEKYILPIPDVCTLDEWTPAWNKERLVDKIEEQKENNERQEALKRKARTFYQNQRVLVYEKDYDHVADYFLGILNEFRMKIDPTLPSPSQIEMKEYKKNRQDYERAGVHIVMIGDSSEAKKMYRNAKNGRWDYYEYGMRYMTYGNKTVILARKLKNNDINDFVKLAKDVNKKYTVKIPTDIQNVEYTFLKECFDGDELFVAKALTAIIGSPLLILGQAAENLGNAIQFVQNVAASRDIEMLQYCIAFYKFLENENAVL